MKKQFLFGFALVGMMVSCQMEGLVEKPTENAESAVVFSASLAPETKTYLDYDVSSGVYKVKWDESDIIGVLSIGADGVGNFEKCNIINGVGTTVAKFAGSNKGEEYIAAYGAWSFNPAEKSVYYKIYSNQYSRLDGKNVDAGLFPMYARSKDERLEFKNLASVLKISLKGDAFIQTIKVEANDETIPMSGDGDVVIGEDGLPSLVMRRDSTASSSITYFDDGRRLSETAVTDFYIVLSPQNYKGGLTITINSRTGSMTKVIDSDVLMSRSEMRAIPAFRYEEQTKHEWALLSMDENNNYSLVTRLTDTDGCCVAEDVELHSSQWCVFVANFDLSTHIGAENAGDVLQPNVLSNLSFNSYGLFRIAKDGKYNIKLFPKESKALFATSETVVCENLEAVKALPDNTPVEATGIIVGVNARGFVMNISDYWGNCVYVYLGENGSTYKPVLGNKVKVTAVKKTYRNFPEISNIKSIDVLDDTEKDFGYGGFYNLLSSEAFQNFEIDKCEYIKYKGTLVKEGIYWVVKVEGSSLQGILEWPIEDLTSYQNQLVLVEGWFLGNSTSPSGVTQRHTLLKIIKTSSGEGSTEDVVPGQDIIIGGGPEKIGE